jgi:flagellum-specific ATP synthase
MDVHFPALDRIDKWHPFGTVQSAVGPILLVTGLGQYGKVGARCSIKLSPENSIWGEIVGFNLEGALIMPFNDVTGIRPGTPVYIFENNPVLYPSLQWKGRILDGLGRPLNHLPLPQGSKAYSLKSSPPPSQKRRFVGKPLDVGVRALNTFVTCCEGQRLGIFAASGVGKSVLLSQMARFTKTDVVVIGLIGERGREVREFIDLLLGEHGKENCVTVVATSDTSPLMRRQAAYTTLTIAEFFRDQGLSVLCLIDSITRFAMALREIGLAVGEPPTYKGYTPSVFAALPQLLERAGPGLEAPSQGDITGLFTVLVDGDDHDEPIADSVRSILDGHIVLERSIGEGGRYPAINILRSLSRMVPDCLTPHQWSLVQRARKILSLQNEMADMIRLGAYQKGTDPELDQAMGIYPRLEKFLQQDKHVSCELLEGFTLLEEILNS